MHEASRDPVPIFICGAQKAGSSSLHAYFCEHPSLCPPSRKETHVFDDESRDWSTPCDEDIDAFFPAAYQPGLRFDDTPITMFWPPCMPRLRAYNPQAKLLFLLRDPTERAWSQWCMETARGNETLSFADAIRSGRRRLDGMGALADERRVYSYVERGFYGLQIRHAMRFFPRGQMLFIESTELRDNHATTLARIASFLQIEPFIDTGPKREHACPPAFAHLAPGSADRALIIELLAHDIEQVRQLTGIDVSRWFTP